MARISIGQPNGIAELTQTDRATTSLLCGMALLIGQIKQDGSKLLTKIISSDILKVVALLIQRN